LQGTIIEINNKILIKFSFLNIKEAKQYILKEQGKTRKHIAFNTKIQPKINCV